MRYLCWSLCLLVGVQLGQAVSPGSALSRTRALLRGTICCSEAVAEEALRPWPNVPQVVIRYVDREKDRLGLVTWSTDTNGFRWYGWVRLDANAIGRTVIAKDWMAVAERSIVE